MAEKQPQILDTNSKDIMNDNLKKLNELFPSVVKDGTVDIEVLKNLIGDVSEPNQEYYNFTWAGKSEAFKIIKDKSTATLKPQKSENESVDFDNTENIFIEGDNLEVLKILQKTYHNSIKMIYIDPPYNKDKDFVYPDRWSEGLASYLEYSKLVDKDGNITSSSAKDKSVKAGRKHSRWLTMMYPRLFLARNLLRDDGVIFISIDDDEVKNLNMICDEIFGKENFIAILPRITKKAGKSTDSIAKNNDYILAYSKSNDFKLNAFNHTDDGFKHQDEYFDERGHYKLNQTLDYDTLGYVKSLDYPIELGEDILYAGGVSKQDYENRRNENPKDGFRWRWSQGKFEFGYKNGFVELKKTSSNRMRIYTKTYQDARIEKSQDGYYVKKIERTKVPTTLDLVDNEYSNDNSKKDLDKLFEKKVFDYAKPISLLKYLTYIGTNQNDIVLDFFAGSGTTADAVMELNAQDNGTRKCISIQLPEPMDKKDEAFKQGYKNISEIAKERIKRAGKKILKENPDSTVDTGFKVFKLSESNFKQWNNSLKSKEELTLAFEEYKDNIKEGAEQLDMLYQVILLKGLSLNSKIQEIKVSDKIMFKVISNDVELLACFEDEITKTALNEVVNLKPIYFICLDASFKNDTSLKTNSVLNFKDADILFETV